MIDTLAVPARTPAVAAPARSRRSLRVAGMAMCAAALLAGCAETVNDNGVTRRQGTGAALGAGLGAAAGLLVGGDDRRNALVGAGIGMLAGAAAGTYLDSQERQLQKDLEGTGATVTNTGDALLVTLPGGVTFQTDSDKVTNNFKRPLNRVARTLNKYPSSYVDVIGHTDSTGDASYNMQLSQRRARSVAAELIQRGVANARIATAGMGETQPVASNETVDGRAANRRVEIKIVPATES
ncbi:Outer membrane protein OmpA [Albimonas donghaensis]|uniref:Outer membrane protein OmpA n=1 Tax=Albimonas donghaensis TaxID=356660 RepID=A0A1H3AQI6_9RHOB|nr:OmpA family protein [Albimonas donghaensis]SDX31946.1 Outer membrane protein OmpA [Albimonas donghaensis]